MGGQAEDSIQLVHRTGQGKLFAWLGAVSWDRGGSLHGWEGDYTLEV